MALPCSIEDEDDHNGFYHQQKQMMMAHLGYHPLLKATSFSVVRKAKVSTDSEL